MHKFFSKPLGILIFVRIQQLFPQLSVVQKVLHGSPAYVFQLSQDSKEPLAW